MTEKKTKVKAVIATVKVGHLEFEGLMLPGGIFGIAVPQIAEIVDTDKNYATQEFKRLLGKDFRAHKVSTELGNQKINMVDLKTFELILAKLDRKGNVKAQNFRDDLAGVSLHGLFCQAYKIKFDEDDVQEQLKQRQLVRKTFKPFLTDALKRFGYSEPWQYGKFVHEMQSALGIQDGTRDVLSIEDLVVLESAQRFIGMAIDEFGIDPYEALKRYVRMKRDVE